MPRNDTTNDHSDPITIAPGNTIQNTGRHMLYMCFVTPAADGDAIELWPGRGVDILTATLMRVRRASRHGGEVKVIPGI